MSRLPARLTVLAFTAILALTACQRDGAPPAADTGAAPLPGATEPAERNTVQILSLIHI
jgi:hypothetical protein